MPSRLHETLIELFRHRPVLAAELLAGPLRVDVPIFQHARLEPGELPDLVPTEYRADGVVTLSDTGRTVLAVVVEAQLRRDPAKRYSWPVYLSTLRARLRCPVILLVVCPDARAATWSATAIDLGHPGWVLKPLVLGPAEVPVVTDPAVAVASPQLAVLSAMAHSAHPERDKVIHAVFEALKSIDLDRAALYADVVLAALPGVTHRNLEALMATGTYEYQSEFARHYFFQGEAKGEAKALLAVLAARDVEVPEAAHARITACTDSEQLEAWIRRAAIATAVEDLFD